MNPLLPLRGVVKEKIEQRSTLASRLPELNDSANFNFREEGSTSDDHWRAVPGLLGDFGLRRPGDVASPGHCRASTNMAMPNE